MGQTESQQINLEKLQQDYFFLEDLEDLIFHNYTQLIEKNTQNIFVLKDILCANDEIYTIQYQKLQKYNKLMHPNLLPINDIVVDKQKQLCSTIYKLYYIFDYTDINLAQQIEIKQSSHQAYKESELWDITINLISALSYLQKNNIHHKDIRPQNIMYYNDVLKITPCDIANNDDIFMQALEGTNKQYAYFSPLQMEALRQKTFPDHNQYKSDVFSLGLTILHLIQLISCQDFYDFQKFSISELDIKCCIETIQSGNQYSQIFLDFIKTMVNVQEATRPDFIDLERICTQNTVILKQLNALKQQQKEVEQTQTCHDETYDDFNSEQLSPINRQSFNRFKSQQSFDELNNFFPDDQKELLKQQNELQQIVQQQQQIQPQNKHLKTQQKSSISDEKLNQYDDITIQCAIQLQKEFENHTLVDLCALIKENSTLNLNELKQIISTFSAQNQENSVQYRSKIIRPTPIKTNSVVKKQKKNFELPIRYDSTPRVNSSEKQKQIKIIQDNVRSHKFDEDSLELSEEQQSKNIIYKRKKQNVNEPLDIPLYDQQKDFPQVDIFQTPPQELNQLFKKYGLQSFHHNSPYIQSIDSNYHSHESQKYSNFLQILRKNSVEKPIKKSSNSSSPVTKLNLQDSRPNTNLVFDIKKDIKNSQIQQENINSPKEIIKSFKENTINSPPKIINSPKETVNSPKEIIKFPKDSIHSPKEIIKSPKDTTHSPKENQDNSIQQQEISVINEEINFDQIKSLIKKTQNEDEKEQNIQQQIDHQLKNIPLQNSYIHKLQSQQTLPKSQNNGNIDEMINKAIINQNINQMNDLTQDVDLTRNVQEIDISSLKNIESDFQNRLNKPPLLRNQSQIQEVSKTSSIMNKFGLQGFKKNNAQELMNSQLLVSYGNKVDDILSKYKQDGKMKKSYTVNTQNSEIRRSVADILKDAKSLNNKVKSSQLQESTNKQNNQISTQNFNSEN